MNKTVKKLMLNKESVAWLTNGLLHNINGGTGFDRERSNACPVPVDNDTQIFSYQGDPQEVIIWG